MKKAYLLIPIVLLAFICSQLSWADVFFKDDFEAGKLDEKKWLPKPDWKLIKPKENLKSLGNFVLDFNTGETNITVQNDFVDYVFEADFQALERQITGFVMRAQDSHSNFYMHQISVTGSPHTANHMRWHWKVGGNWNVAPIPFLKGKTLEANKWYRAKFIVEGFTFKSFVVETEEYEKNPRGVKFEQIGDWEDKAKLYKKGAIGFRASGGEHMQYDNVIVYKIGFDPLSVDPNGKLATAWGELKRK
jgi:hypothetical protein